MSVQTPYENEFVTHLNRYTTVSSEHEAAFDEFISQSNWDDDLRIETQTKEFVLRNFLGNSPVSIILTGNAGDGKTYICRKVIEEVTGWSSVDWKDLVGDVDLPHVGRRLRVIKDLSELGEDAGRQQLEDLQSSYTAPESNTVFLIAANEGRLRALLVQNGMSELYKEVDRQLRDGDNLEPNKKLIVINLNDATTSSYIEQTLDWITDESHWEICSQCPAFHHCPIRHNAEKLSNPYVMQRVKLLYQIIEQLDDHATIRDMLIHLAYVTTGGLRCQDVISKRSQKDWQDQLHLYVYYENVWGISASSVFRSKVSVINFVMRLDVGESSVFEIDDFIINGDAYPHTNTAHKQLFAEELDLNWKMFRQDRDAYVRSGTASPNADIQYPIMDWLPHCRRKLFFEWDRTSFTNRLFPFLFVDQYFGLLEQESSIEREKASRSIVLGLNRAFSGLFLNDDRSLFITSQYAHAVEQPVPIVQFSIPRDYIDLEVVPQNTVFVDRNMATLELVIPPPPKVRQVTALRWPINLLMFEYLMRRANGSTSNILASECELEIRQLKDALLSTFGSQSESNTVAFFAAEDNRYQLRKIQIEKKH